MTRPAALACLLALVLALTGVEAAIARGQPAPAGFAVICRGAVLVTVALDADGAPVEERRLCPDALGALLDLPGLSAEPVAVPATAPPPRGFAVPPLRALSRISAPRARGPPLAL